jgi:hypothetical protein
MHRFMETRIKAPPALLRNCSVEEGRRMRWPGLFGFLAGVVLAASPTVLAQTGPTFPTDPPVSTAAGDPKTGSDGSSGSSTEPGQPQPSTRGSADIPPIPGPDLGAGR